MDLEFFKRPAVAKRLEEGVQMAMKILAEQGLDKDPALLAVLDGQTIAQAKGLTRADLEVLYAYGFHFIVNRDAKRGEEIFFQLCLIDPLEAKNHYCLGVIRQMQQKWDMAIDDFARFCALDATNPEGYRRWFLNPGESVNNEGLASSLDVVACEVGKSEGAAVNVVGGVPVGCN